MYARTHTCVCRGEEVVSGGGELGGGKKMKHCLMPSDNEDKHKYENYK